MEKLKDPALLWCGANTVVTVGGFVWLYNINVKLASQLSELTEAVKIINAQHQENPKIFKNIEDSLNKLHSGVQAVAFQLGQHQEFLLHLDESNTLIGTEIVKTNQDFRLPRKPSKIKKLSRAVKKKKRQEYSSSDESDESSSNSSSSSEDDDEILRRRREAKKKAKAKKKN